MSQLMDAGSLSVEVALERLAKHTTRDEEFAARFGKWQRPDFAGRYNLEGMAHLVRFHPFMDGTLDVALFIKALRPEDRQIAGEVARFVSEEFIQRPATDKTLATFRLHFFRRLDACGF